MEKITNYKVTDQEIKEKGVQAVQGEVLYGDPAENKRLFDRLVTFAIGKYNAALEWLVDKTHVHENAELLDSLVEENAHSHGNKKTLDDITSNMVAAWNQMTGLEDWILFEDILEEETIQVAKETGFLSDDSGGDSGDVGDSGGNTGGDTGDSGDTGGDTGGDSGDSGGGDETDPDAYGFQGIGGQTMKLTKPANIIVKDIQKDAAGNITKYVNAIVGKVGPEDGVYSFGFIMSAGTSPIDIDNFLPYIDILSADRNEAITRLNYGGYDAASKTITLNVPTNKLNTNTSYVLEFGADVRGNNPEKTLGVPIDFEFVTKR